jgi:hypothetical protein
MAVLSRTVVIPLEDYPTGTTQMTARNISDAANFLHFEFLRSTTATPTIWPNESTKLNFDMEGSFDGVTWTPAGGFGASGGIHVSRDGSEAPITTVTVPLPAGTNRQLRATAVITAGPLRTSGTIELRD